MFYSNCINTILIKILLFTYSILFILSKLLCFYLKFIHELFLAFKMKNNSPKFRLFIINFYRILGITFGGLSFDKNGNIIKSKFWYRFSWFGFVIYTIVILFFMISSFSYKLISKMGLIMYLLVNVM